MQDALRVRDVIAVLEEVAPPSTAAEWDNVGLLAGDPEAVVSRVVASLDAGPRALQQAGAGGLLITHHPLIFRPLRSLAETGAAARLLAQAVRNGTAVYAAHTNFDACDYGMGRACCEELGLSHVRRAFPKLRPELDKIVVFVPESHRLDVLEAMCAAGAGRIGDYIKCSFAAAGTGTFEGLDITNPAVGERGVFEQVPELRLEVVCPRACRSRVISAMLAVHPYEEAAFDIYPLARVEEFHQITWCGQWSHAIPLREAVARVEQALCAGAAVRVVGNLDRAVRTVAVATGTAAKHLHRLHNIDLLITGDIDHHAALEAQECGLAVVAAGHFHTEKWFAQQVRRLLDERLPELNVPILLAPEVSPFTRGV